MAEVAFVTCQQAPDVNEHDQLAADVLHEYGVRVTPAVWDAAGIEWARFDCVVIRSTWDYYFKPDRYADWLRSLQSSGVRLWNPPQAVLENINKRYLLSLAGRGVNVVPTEYVEAAEGAVLHDVLERRGWDEVVLKPAVSGCALGAWRSSLTAAQADQPRFAEQLRGQDLLVQQYMPQIAHGEWSLVFFAGRYSHAVLKRPAAGDFRVHREYGGSASSAEPDTSLIEQAQAVLAAVDSPLLYARVDGIERAGRLILMEMEINEPFLFLGFCEGAAGDSCRPRPPVSGCFRAWGGARTPDFANPSVSTAWMRMSKPRWSVGKFRGWRSS
jgi:glutathione synthase/RimK-type ligase-like ATP-grasp enzyme